MKKSFRVVAMLLCSAILLPMFAYAADDEAEENAPKRPTVEEKMQKWAKAGTGVQFIKKDKKGEIVSVVVVGESEISTVLGSTKGIQLARQKASQVATGEFLKWLKQKASMSTSDNGEVVILREGSEGDEETKVESGKSIDKSSSDYQTAAEGLVRGLQLLHKEVDSKGKKLTLVMGWDKGTSDRTKKIAADQADDSLKSAKTAEGKRNTGKGKSGERSKKGEASKDKEFDSESATTDAAKDFVP
jgi:hypothetical protein